MSFLDLFGGNKITREGCLFDMRGSTVDLSTMCHEARSIDVNPGEQVYVSVRDTRKPEGEQFAAVGGGEGRGTCHLKAVELDTTLLVRIWAAKNEIAAASTEGEGNRRECGELRIPLATLLMKGVGMLYQTWVTLDSPGLYDSVASIGLENDNGTFEQKLVEGPCQLFQPKVCLSICKTNELDPKGRLLLNPDAPSENRVGQWGPLLRSQQQHVVMSRVLHQQSSHIGEAPGDAEQRERSAQDLKDVRQRVQMQGDALEDLQRQLRETEQVMERTRSAGMDESQRRGGRPGSPGRTVGERVEAEQLKATNHRSQAEVAALRSELERVEEEANRKIDAANKNIRALRQQRDEALQEGERLAQETNTLHKQQEELEVDMKQLAEQKEALLRIVEDLHQTCVGAGLQTMGRGSIDSITASFRLS